MNLLIQTENMAQKSLKWMALLLIIAAVLVSAFKGLKPDPQFLLDYIGRNLHSAWSGLLDQYKMNSYLFWAPLAGIFLAERFIPIKKQQKLFTVGFFQDLVWFVTVPVFGVFLVYRFKSTFKNIYEKYFDFFSIDVLVALPVPLQIIIVILAVDFLSWFSHLLKHKVKLFWHFHSIHHSQREMNFMTDARVHPVERMISVVIRFFPMTLLELRHGVPLGIAWWFFTTWHTLVYHASIHTNYGLLRYILVTPQSHRIHHSSQPRHQDLNYGVIFSFWDRLFGTQYRHYDEYPDTGVADDEFPVERRLGVWSLLHTLLLQLIYPFRMIIHRGI